MNYKGSWFVKPIGTVKPKKAKNYKSPFSLPNATLEDIRKAAKKGLKLGPDTPIIGNKKKKK